MAGKLKALQLWCKNQCEGYKDVYITNMTTSWKSGLAFCAIIHNYNPELIDYENLSKENVFENCELAFDSGKKLGIQVVLVPQDMVIKEVPDMLSIITYVSQYYYYFKDKPQVGGPNFDGRKLPQKKSIISAAADTPEMREPPVIEKPKVRRSTFGDACCVCGGKVYVIERHIDDNYLFHRVCFQSLKKGDSQTLIEIQDNVTSEDPKEAKLFQTLNIYIYKENLMYGEKVDLISNVKSSTHIDECQESSSPEFITCDNQGNHVPSKSLCNVTTPVDSSQTNFQMSGDKLSSAINNDELAISSYSKDSKLKKPLEFNSKSHLSANDISPLNHKCKPSIDSSCEPHVSITNNPMSTVSSKLSPKLPIQTSSIPVDKANSEIDVILPSTISNKSSIANKLTKTIGTSLSIFNIEPRFETSYTSSYEKKQNKSYVESMKTKFNALTINSSFQNVKNSTFNLKDNLSKLITPQSKKHKTINLNKWSHSVETIPSMTSPKSEILPLALPRRYMARSMECLYSDLSRKSGMGNRPLPLLPDDKEVSYSKASIAAEKPIPVEMILNQLHDVNIQWQKLEKEGIDIEQKIREEKSGDVDDNLLVQWFQLVNKKNTLIRKESELKYRQRQQELEAEHADLDLEVRLSMGISGNEKTSSQKIREDSLIQMIDEVVSARNAIVDSIEEDRLRYQKEDKEISDIMSSKGFIIDETEEWPTYAEEMKKEKKSKKKYQF